MLTREQRLRAAKEARRLASLIVEGRAPRLDPDEWTLCACGWVAKEAGIETERGEGDGYIVERVAWPDDPPGCGPVSMGLLRHGPDGAVFPLLAMADALEEG